VFDPPLTSFSFVASFSSSTPIDTGVSDLTLFVSRIPLAQCIRLEMGELCRGDISVIKNESLVRLKGMTLVEPFLKEAPFKELCGDVVLGSAAPHIGRIESTHFIPFTPYYTLLFSCIS